MRDMQRDKITALDEIEPKYRRRGYQVVRQPSDEELPDFLKGRTLDMIAIGKKPNVAVVVRLGGTGRIPAGIADLKALFAGQQDWSLQTYFFEAGDPPFETLSEDLFDEILRRIEALSPVDRQAAFLMAWSLLEAAMRDSQLIEQRPLDEKRMIAVLGSEGILQGVEVAAYLDLAKKRNGLAHGQLTLEPSREEIARILRLARQIRAESRALV